MTISGSGYIIFHSPYMWMEWGSCHLKWRRSLNSLRRRNWDFVHLWKKSNCFFNKKKKKIIAHARQLAGSWRVFCGSCVLGYHFLPPFSAASRKLRGTNTGRNELHRPLKKKKAMAASSSSLSKSVQKRMVGMKRKYPTTSASEGDTTDEELEPPAAPTRQIIVMLSAPCHEFLGCLGYPMGMWWWIWTRGWTQAAGTDKSKDNVCLTPIS